MDADALPDELRAHLGGWLGRRPWVPDPGGVPVVDVLDLVPLGEGWPLVVWCPLRVSGARGISAELQLLVALTPESADALPSTAIGRVGPLDGVPPLVAWEVSGHEAARAVLARSALGDRVGERPVAEVVEETAARTEVVVDDRWRVRLHRPLVDGPRPDVAVPDALAGTDAAVVAPCPVDVWRHDAHELVTVWAHDPVAESGADLFRRSVEEVLDRGCPPSEADLDVGAVAGELGGTVARLHLGLAGAFGVGPLAVEALVAGLGEEVDRLAPPGIDLGGITGAFDRLRHADDLGAEIRVHGDLRPGQLRRGGSGWQVVAFEGDPFRPVAADPRSSPLRDLAGMVAALGRVADDSLRARGVDPGDLDGREPVLLADSWTERAVGALVDGYAATAGIDALLPRSRDARDGLLTLFELVATLEEVAHHPRSGRPRALERPTVVRLTTADHHRRW